MTASDNLEVDLASLRSRLRQQQLVANFGTAALSAAGFQELLQEAARVAAKGLSTEFAKVLEYLPSEDVLLIRAGVGWREGVVGIVKLGADIGSPTGFALKVGEPVISNHLADEQRFRTPIITASRTAARRAIGNQWDGKSV